MSDTTEKKPLVELRIQFDGTTTQVSGPITNELLCHAMLESAGQTIRQWNVNRKQEAAHKAQEPLVRPNPLITPKDLHIA